MPKGTFTVIRMGAANWDITLPRKDSPDVDTFDLRSLSKDDQHKVQRLFVDAFEAAQKNQRKEASPGKKARKRKHGRSKQRSS